MSTYLPDAKPSDVIGQLILEIDQSFEEAKGIYFAWNFYRLGSGLILTLGFDDDSESPLLEQAITLDVSDLEGVINNRIESTWRLSTDHDFSPYALRMESGLYVVELQHALEGTGPPGICVLEQAEISVWELTRLW